jgi:hypothetical protein
MLKKSQAAKVLNKKSLWHGFGFSVSVFKKIINNFLNLKSKYYV